MGHPTIILLASDVVILNAAFSDADTDGDGRISYEEFQAWYGSNELQEEYSTDELIGEIKSLTNIESFDVRTMIDFLMEGASKNGFISRRTFTAKLWVLVERNLEGTDRSPEQDQRAAWLLDQLFNVFDGDKNGGAA